MDVSKIRCTKGRIAEKIVFIIILIPYLAFLVDSIQYAFIKFDDCTATVVGRVKEIRQCADGSNNYYPIFEIEVNSIVYTHRSKSVFKYGDWKEGDEVELKYNSKNPEKMVIQQEIDSHKNATIWNFVAAAIFGLIILRLGYLIFR